MTQLNAARKIKLITKAGLSFFREFRISDGELLSSFEPPFGGIQELKEYFSGKRPIIFRALSGEGGKAAQYYKENYSKEFEETLQVANEVCSGRINLLGRVFENRDGIDWYFEPFSATHFKKLHYRMIHGTSGQDIMFTYELHKHQFLVVIAKAYWLTHDESYAKAFISIICDWIDKNPPETGPAYTSTLNVSQRIISWILAWPFLADSESFREDFICEFMRAICEQAQFVKNNSTAHWRPRNNFMIAENTALLLTAVLVPELKESEKWIKDCAETLNAELKNQVWKDGTSFEQSIGYQKLVMDFIMLAVIACDANNIRLPAGIKNTLFKLCESLINLTQPNGEVAHIGDISTESGFRMAAHDNLLETKKYMSLGALIFKREDMRYLSESFKEEAFWFFGMQGAHDFSILNTKEPEYKSRAFKEGGYFIMRSGWEKDAHHLVIDCGHKGLGKNGPGGHGHNDMLHFTLCAYGKPFIVDPGTYMYFASREWRDYFRSSSSHNTVIVDGKEIAELGKTPFKIKGDVKPILNNWDVGDEYVFFSGSHTGYRRLKNPVLHTREILFVRNSYWIINDTLEGEGKHGVEIFFHLAPMSIGMDKAALSVKTDNINGPNIVIVPVETEGLKAAIEEGWVSNYYGIKEKAPVLKYFCEIELPFRHRIIIFPLAEGEERPIEQIKSDAIAEWDRYKNRLQTVGRRL